MALPSLGGSHSLTTGKMLAFMQVRSVAGDIHEDVASSGVVEQIEALFFAVVQLHRPITSILNRTLNEGEN